MQVFYRVFAHRCFYDHPLPRIEVSKSELHTITNVYRKEKHVYISGQFKSVNKVAFYSNTQTFLI